MIIYNKYVNKNKAKYESKYCDVSTQIFLLLQPLAIRNVSKGF